MRILVPLRVTGTIGTRKVDALVEGDRLTLRADGAVRLTVTPATPGRLLDASTADCPDVSCSSAPRAALTLARLRQYRTYLGNPDPTGPNKTTYIYRNAARPAPPPVAANVPPDRDWATTIAVAAGLLLATAAALVVWSRS